MEEQHLMLLNNNPLFKAVLFYPANLITLSRLLIMIAILPFFLTQPILFSVAAVFCELADPLDGYIARATGKSSQIGKILDMVVDRLFVFFECTVLSVLYPHWCPVFMLIGLIDIASHYVVIYSCSVLKLTNHKRLFKNSNSKLLTKYYNEERTFMFLLGLAYDFSFFFLYLYHFYPHFALIVCAVITVCVGSIKIVIHLLQMGESLIKVAKLDRVE